MSGAYSPQPRMTDMTYWGKPSPMRGQNLQTEHWSKLKIKNAKDGDFSDMRSGDVAVSWDPTISSQWKKDGYITSHQEDQQPGSPRSARVRLPPIKTVYNQRAKEGFRYWLIEKPKPTSFGKYGIGSYKTVLGLGNAPRT